MANSPEEIKKSVRTYLFVGGVLFLGTIITVLVEPIGIDHFTFLPDSMSKDAGSHPESNV